MAATYTITITQANTTVYYKKFQTNALVVTGKGATNAAARSSAVNSARNGIAISGTFSWSSSYTYGTYSTDQQGYTLNGAVWGEQYSTQSDGSIGCVANGRRESYVYQILLPFTCPSGLTATNLSTATISYKAKSGDYITLASYICAPATSSSAITAYTAPNSSTFYSSKATVAGKSSGGQTYSATITDQLRQALSTNQLWLLLTVQNDGSPQSNYIHIDGNFTITCTAEDKKVWINVNGTWKRAQPWINVNGTWKQATAWINVNGTWKKC